MTPESEDPVDRSSEVGHPENMGAANAAERVIERFGGIRPMAAKLEVPVTTVQGWKKRGVIPALRHSDIRSAASRHSIQLDPNELAASDPGDGEAGPGTPVRSPDTETTEARRHAGPATRADGVGVAVASSIIAVIAAIAAATAPLWSPRLFPQTRGSSGDLVQEVQGLNGRLGAVEQRIPQDPSARLDAAEKAIAAVRASVESLPREAGAPAPPDPAVAERLGRLEQRLDSAPAPVAPDPAIPDRLSRLEQRLETIAGQLRDLQATSSQSAAAAQSVQTLGGTVRELQGSAEELRRSFSGLQSGQDQLAANFKQAQQLDLRAQAAMLALGQLRMSLGGSEPFAGELATVRGLDGPLSQAVAGALDRIAPFASSGAPTRLQLRERFEPIAGAIVRAERATGDTSWADETLTRIASLITIRRAPGETEGDSTAAIVARAEARLQANDLSGAVEALGALSGKAAEIAAPWLGQARARLALDHAAGEIARAAIARLGGAAQPVSAEPAARPAQ